MPPSNVLMAWPDQERCFTLERARPGTPPFVRALRLEFRGPLDVGAIARALDTVVLRHELLRSRWRRSDSGLTIVDSPGPAAVTIGRARDLQVRERIEGFLVEPLDVSSHSALKARVFDLGADRQVLIVALHELAGGASALDTLVREIVELVTEEAAGRSTRLPEIEGCATSLLRSLAGSNEAAQALAGALGVACSSHVVDLPTEGLPPPFPSRRARALDIVFESSALSLLDRAVARCHTAAATVFAAAWVDFVATFAFDRPLSVGLGPNILGRWSPPGLVLPDAEPLPGVFAPRTETAEARVQELVAQMAWLAGQPVAQLAELVQIASDPRHEDRPPFFSTSLDLGSGPWSTTTEQLAISAREIGPMASRRDAHLVLTTGQHPAARLVLDADLFEAPAAHRLAGAFQDHAQRFLCQLSGADVTAAFPMADADLKRALLWSSTGFPYPRHRTVGELVERLVQRDGHRVAVQTAAGPLSLQALAEQARRIANWLRDTGVTTGHSVAIAMEPSPSAVAAVLGIWLADGAVVALSLDATVAVPSAAELGIRAVVGREEDVRRLGFAELPGLDLWRDREALGRRATTLLALAATPESPALWLPGSGPGFVALSHRALVNYATWAAEEFHAKEGAPVPLLGPLADPAAMLSLLVALLTPRPLRALPLQDSLAGLADAADLERPFAFVALSSERAAEFLLALDHRSVPGLAEHLIVQGPPTDGLLLSRLSAAAPGATLHAVTSIPEAGAALATRRFSPGEPIPDGVLGAKKVLPNTRVRFRDLLPGPIPRPLPVLISGDGVALRSSRPGPSLLELVRDSGDSEQREVAGVFAIPRRDGSLTLCRPGIDLLPTRRGPVPAADVVLALRRLPGVIHARLVLDSRIVGAETWSAELWLAPHQHVDRVRAVLAEALPSHLLPHRLIARTAAGEPSLLPRIPKRLEQAWCRALGQEACAPEDDFFELGGTLALASRVVRDCAATGLHLALADLLRRPVLRDLARVVRPTLPANEDEADRGGTRLFHGPVTRSERPHGELAPPSDGASGPDAIAVTTWSEVVSLGETTSSSLRSEAETDESEASQAETVSRPILGPDASTADADTGIQTAFDEVPTLDEVAASERTVLHEVATLPEFAPAWTVEVGPEAALGGDGRPRVDRRESEPSSTELVALDASGDPVGEPETRAEPRSQRGVSSDPGGGIAAPPWARADEHPEDPEPETSREFVTEPRPAEEPHGDDMSRVVSAGTTSTPQPAGLRPTEPTPKRAPPGSGRDARLRSPERSEAQPRGPLLFAEDAATSGPSPVVVDEALGRHLVGLIERAPQGRDLVLLGATALLLARYGDRARVTLAWSRRGATEVGVVAVDEERCASAWLDGLAEGLARPTEDDDQEPLAELAMAEAGTPEWTAIGAPLTVTITPRGERYDVRVAARIPGLSSERAELLLEHFRLLLRGLTSHHSEFLAHLPMLTPREQELLTHDVSGRDLAIGSALDRTVPVAERLFAATRETPDQIAISTASGTVTFGALGAAISQVSVGLRTPPDGDRGGVRVGSNSPLDRLILTLGVLGTGRTLALGEVEVAGWSLPFVDAEVGNRDAANWPPDAPESARDATAPIVDLDAVALVVAGKDGCALHSERALSHAVGQLEMHIGITGDDRVLVGTGSDVEDLVPQLAALARGASLVLPARCHPVRALFDALARYRVTILALGADQVSEFFSQAAEDPEITLESLRTLVVLGPLPNDAAHAAFRLRFVEKPALITALGPRECLGVALFSDGTDRAPGTFPRVGRPAPGVEAYVLDAWRRPCPIGVTGRLHLGGSTLARGYVGALEAETRRFVAHPFSAEPGRLFRTDSLARWRADGELELVS